MPAPMHIPCPPQPLPATSPSRRRLLCASAAASCALPRAAPAAEPRIEILQLGASTLELQFADDFDAALLPQAREWVRQSAQAAAAYFGRFPVPTAELLLIPQSGAGVLDGTTFALPSIYIRLRIGRATTPQQFHDDWILVHEMVHLAVPRVPSAHNWLHEGIATYVEGVARGRAGLVDAGVVWRGWMQQMPQGQPQPGDAGLDHTPTWARTYWGGAMFCLLADVQLLQRSGGRAGLQQALQGVLAAGGSYAVAWPLPRILAAADAATGQGVLAELYEQMRDQPAPVDLDGLFQHLGVRSGAFDEQAPLAAVRRAILS
jgi:hypothetical protein